MLLWVLRGWEGSVISWDCPTSRRQRRPASEVGRAGMVQLKELLSEDQVADPEIRLWVANDSKTAFTRHYLAEENSIEVGFLSADVDSECEYFVIYKLFVPPRLRRQGLGNLILKAAEELGNSLGYRNSLLRAHTLADEFSQQDLEDWYFRHG